MDFVMDTDTASMLSKTKRLGLLRELFPGSEFFITTEVYNELLKAKESGYDYLDEVFKENFKILQPKTSLMEGYKKKSGVLKSIHSGELQSVLVCREKNMTFITNDKKAQEFCDSQKVEWLNITDLLRLSLLKGIHTRDEVLKIMDEIEKREKTKIKGMDEILKEFTGSAN